MLSKIEQANLQALNTEIVDQFSLITVSAAYSTPNYLKKINEKDVTGKLDGVKTYRGQKFIQQSSEAKIVKETEEWFF